MESSYRQAIVKYYDDTRLDYRVLWLNKKNRSVHFGYYDEGITDHGEALENLNRELAKRAGVKDGDRILDAGCGQGGSSLWLAEHHSVTVEGITLVPHQVEMAIAESKERGKDKVLRFTEQDYTSTDFKDSSFDVVWACESMCHAEHKQAFYEEAYRVLKPGGRLICADYIRRERPLSESGEIVLHQWLAGWSIKDIDTQEEHFQHMSSLGFKESKIENVTKHTEPSLRHLYSMSSKLWGIGKVLRFVGLRNKVMHGNQFASIKQYEALNAGEWFYGIISAIK